MLFLVLLGAAIGVSAVPLVDVPETPFNEADSPVNLAPPVLPRIKFIRPAGDRIVLPGLSAYCTGCVVGSWVPDPAAAPSQRHRHSLQDLLCTFLI